MEYYVQIVSVLKCIGFCFGNHITLFCPPLNHDGNLNT
jgi:hypothetical protein